MEIKPAYRVVAKGHVDGINLKTCRFTFSSKNKDIGQNIPVKNHKEAINLALKTLLQSKSLNDYKEIFAVGHRVVHGGEKFTKAAKIDAKVIKTIKEISPLAPLHNPANLEGILACKEILPKTPQIAIFDTSFFKTIPEKAFLYGVPLNWYKNFSVRRFGFHGTSHEYVVNEAIKLLKKKNPKIISCHLGNGSSITASLNGKALDTSMGLTPLEGVIMGTRCGSIDPSIINYMAKKLKTTSEKIEKILIEESGLKGLSQLSSDMRLIYKESLKNNKKAALTIEILSYQIAKYCGAYTAILGGLDAIIFTGGLGEKAFYVREKVCDYLNFLGAKIDNKQNKKNLNLISAPKSKIKIFVIPTNEEKQIAMETLKTVSKKA